MNFADSANWLHGQQSQVAGHCARYIRVAGAEEWDITAVPSVRQYLVTDAQERQTLVTAWDWLIQACDLPLTPQRGDEIHDGDRKYTVLPLPPEPVARHMDSERQLWIVHTKLTEDESE